VAFLLDSSTKSTTDAWSQILTYTTNSLIARYNINPNCVRVAVITYSDNAVVNIQLNQYGDRNSLQQAVLQLRLLNGGSNLATAMNLLSTQVFTSTNIQMGAGLVAIVVTDQLQSSQQLTTAVDNVKSQNVRIIAVGVTGPCRVNQNVLQGISTDNYTDTVNDYSQLDTTANMVALQWGCFPSMQPTPAPRKCYFMCFSNIFHETLNTEHHDHLHNFYIPDTISCS